MAIESSRKKSGYAAWILTKVFDELTGNYYRNEAAENQAKQLMKKNNRTPDGNASCVDESDRPNDVGFK